MLGVGISAIGVIAMILYYRHMQNAAQTAAPDSGMGSFPYFQTAALPSGSGSGDTSVASSPAAPSLDINGLIDKITAASATSDTSANANNFASSFGSIIGDLLSQQATELSAIPGGIGTPVALAGFANPLPGGGFTFGTAAAPVQSGLPSALGWLYGSNTAGGAFVNTQTTNKDFTTNTGNSTNSTPPSATVH